MRQARYAPWGYHVTFLEGRKCMCSCYSTPNPLEVKSHTYTVAVTQNKITRHDYDTFPATCDEVEKDPWRQGRELPEMLRVAFRKTYNSVMFKPSYSPFFSYAVLKIDGKLDAGGRLVSWNPDAINAAARSIS